MKSLLQGGLAAFLLASAIILVDEPRAEAQAPQDKIPAYTLSTATTGGAFHQGGVSLSALVKIKLLPGENIDLTTRNSSGSMENIARLSQGTSDFAIVQALLGHHARRGTGPAQSLGPQRALRAVAMLWPNIEHFIVRKSAAPTGSIKDLLQLAGRRLSFGREASAIESNRVLLDNLGLDLGQDFDQAFLAFRQSARAFERGEIDGLSLPASTPMPAFVDLIEQLGPDAVILSWADDDLRKADGGLGLWSPITIPANTYVGQTEPIETIAQPNFLAVRADLDDDIVYAVTKTIFENLSFLRRLHRPFEFLTLERAIEGLPVPLHPGALRYFQEVRLDIGETVLAESSYDVFGKDGEDVSAIRDEVRRGVVSLMTPEDGTSDLLVNELVDVMADARDLRVLPMKGKGTAHNLADLLYLSGVDIGVLQVDAMDFARRRDIFPDLTSKIRYITKWHDLEVHLLVRDDVLRLDHLMGEPVNFGPRGSGSEVTALRLFNRSRIPVRQTSFAHDIALEKLKAGEIAGMVYVAGKPIPLLQRIEVRDGLRLLPLPVIDDDGLTRAATLTETDYPALVFGSRAVDTLAVPSVLAAYNWPADNDRFQPIATFVDHLLARLDQLQASPRHPKWQEVDPSFNLVSWQRHPTVEAYLKQAGAVNKLIGQGGPLVATIRAAGKAPATAVTGPETVRQKQEPPVDATTSHHRRPVF